MEQSLMSAYKDLSGLFVRSKVMKYQNGDLSAIDKVLHKHSLTSAYQGLSYSEVLKKIYQSLVINYQNEYVIKNEFLNRYLAPNLAGTDSIVLNELKMGPATVDLCFISKSSCAYEIKTALDSDARLAAQLNTYNRVFNKVSVIFPLEHYLKYKEYGDRANLIAYSDEGRVFETIGTIKPNSAIDVDSLMVFLHTKEYMSIVSAYYEREIIVNDFDRFDVCKEMIRQIPFDELNILVLNAIKSRRLQVKSRRINNFFFSKEHNELNQISLALNLNQATGLDLLHVLSNSFVN